MATSFPAGLDSLTNPSSGDSLSSPSHSAQHANVNDAVEALQAKVGVDGSAVTSSLDYKVANAGLVHIASADFSAVASFNIDNCFSSQYRNYRLVLTTTTTVGAQTIFARLRTGSTDSGSNYYWGGYYLQYGSNTFTGEGSTAATNTWRISQTAGDSALTMDIFSPNLADKTMYIAHSLDDGGFTRAHNGYNETATQYTGLNVYFLSTSMTGRYSMYGYNNG